MRQALIYPGEDGYWVAECPSLPGCLSQGKTKEEAIANIKEAISGYIKFKLSNVSAKEATYKGEKAIEVTMPSELYQDPKKEALTDRPNLAWLPVDFHNGSIECDVAAALATDAPDYARGFIGIGLRIDSKLNFEGIYLRPANSRVDDQVRRNHSIQYFSLPGYDFARFRKESPERYESYADMGLGEWIHMKIEVRQNKARLYVNGMKQPSFVVNDLKLGPGQRGGSWILDRIRNHRVFQQFENHQGVIPT
ncbi:MAG: type II toxin-antitoxin system HicB family antitoxin [Thermodesulfobacteriota bacterium]